MNLDEVLMIILLTTVFIVLFAIVLTILDDEKKSVKNKKSNKMKKDINIYFSYSWGNAKYVDNIKTAFNGLVNSLLPREDIDTANLVYNSKHSIYQEGKLVNSDLIIFVIDDRQVLTYGMKEELELTQKLGIPYLFYFNKSNSFYRNFYDFNILKGGLSTSRVAFGSRWDVNFNKYPSSKTITNYLKGSLTKENLNKQKSETMAKLYIIDQRQISNPHMLFTPTILNAKKTWKEWNELGYKKSLLREVDQYIDCEFGNTDYNDAPVKVRVYKDRTEAKVDGVWKSIPISQWQEAYHTKNIKVGDWYVGARCGTIAIGCMVGKYDEIAKILKAWSSL